MTDRARTVEPMAVVTAAEVEQAERTIGDLVRETPVLRAGELSRRFGASVVLKAENLQHTGSFKLRGASNKLARMSKSELAAGVVTASPGHHRQAVAPAPPRPGVPAPIFLPAGAPVAQGAPGPGY